MGRVVEQKFDTGAYRCVVGHARVARCWRIFKKKFGVGHGFIMVEAKLNKKMAYS
jgi:hypothetical protein